MSAPIVLVVEDNPITRKMLRFALESEGYAVREAADGQTALRMAEQERPDLVLQDYVLPDMDGLQLMQSLRALPAGAEIPLVVVTGMVSRLEELREYAGPRTNFLPKPVEPSRLLDVVRAHLSREQPAPGGGRLVLVVDDELLNLKLAMVRLRDAGFRVETASGGEEALAKAGENVPDAILSDVLMPGLDGFLLCQALRKDPRLARVPVVLLSASYVEARDQELAREVGANALLPRTPDLRGAIDALLEGVSRGGASPTAAPEEEVEALHAERVQNQLEKQLARNAALLRQGAIQAAALSVVRGLAEALANPRDLPSVLGDVLVHCLDATGLSTGLLYLPTADGGLRLGAQAGLPPGSRAEAAACFGDPGFLNAVLEGGEPVAYGLSSSEGLSPAMRNFAQRVGRRSGLVIPFVVAREKVGVLVLAADSQDLTEAAWRGFARALGVQFGQTIAVGRSLFRGAASEARYHTLMEEANDAILLLDRDYRIIEANRTAESLVGRPRSQIVGRRYDDFLALEDREDSLRGRAALLALGSLPVVERRLLKPDGTSIAVEVSGSLVQTGEEPVVLAILRDVTARKRAEAHRATRYAITQVLAESATIEEAAPRLLNMLCEHLGWAFGALWTDADTGTLRCHTTWHAAGAGLEEFAETTRRVALASGVGLPGRVLAAGHGLWTRDAAQETLLLRERAALVETANLHATCSFPLRAGDRILGVLELFSHEVREADDEVSGLLTDIAEQVGQFWRRTQELNAAQERLRHVVSSSPAVLYSLRVDGQTLVPDWVSSNIEAAIGYAPGEVAGADWWWERVHPDDRARLSNDVAALRETDHIEREYRFRHKDGGYVWIRDEQRLLRDTSGHPVEVVGSWWDVTDRMRAELRLQQSEEHYRLLFESNPHPMWVYDPATLAFLEVNPAAVRLYGFSREEFLTMTIADIRPPEEFPALIADVRDLQKTGATVQGVWRHRKKDGTLLDVDLISNPIDFHGKAARLVLAHDITEKRLLEAQLLQSQKMEAIGRLAGGVAHDFNNLLGVITGYNELLRRDLGPGHASQGRLEEVRKAAERAAALTRQLLAFSRKQVMQPSVLDPRALVANLETMLRRLIEESIELKTVLHPVAGRVKADPGQLEQVVMNLVVNARDAMPGGGRLRIEVKNARLDRVRRPGVAIPPGEYVMLAISDTGVGMDKETQRHIFEPFFTTKEQGKGTGLGLATVYGIVKQSGGFIWVYSEPGLGTTFRIYLPRVDEPLSASAAPAGVAVMRGTETILVCEDEAALRAIVREGLEDHGYHVLEARTGEEALQVSAAHSGPIHLLLTDVVMPGMNGRALAGQIASLRPEIRVLFASGYMEEEAAHHGLLDPGATLIQKPFSLDELVRRVREVLERGDPSR